MYMLTNFRFSLAVVYTLSKFDICCSIARLLCVCLMYVYLKIILLMLKYRMKHSHIMNTYSRTVRWRHLDSDKSRYGRKLRDRFRDSRPFPSSRKRKKFELRAGTKRGEKLQTLATRQENFHTRSVYRKNLRVYVIKLVCSNVLRAQNAYVTCFLRTGKSVISISKSASKFVR